ncbi:hypothetical protein [Mycobacterium sp.]|uniref:hypothetical protein n=1 Tax=Mycobacterium sp. TaxID=1785 RepID=UPI003BABF998
MPNRRRRKLSTAMSAVAALAVASPCAYFLVYESTAGTEPQPEHHEFVQAALLGDLPGELMSALSQGLSQFGINLPPVPSLTGTGGADTGLTNPDLMSPGLTSPGLTSPDLATPGLTSPDLATPGLTSPGLTDPGLTDPGLTDPGLTPATPGAAPTAGTGLTDPALTSPAGVTPGLTSPAGLDPTLTSPGMGANEVPITTPVGMDPGLDGTYPILGDPSLGGTGATASGTGGSGGIVQDVMDAANQLGAGQAIDLIKGVLMPSIMQAVQNGGGAAPAGAAAPAVPAPAVPAAAPPVAAPLT